MERRAAILALALTLPLALYGIPYAYAATTSSTYEMIQDFTLPPGGSAGFVVSCLPGDVATGGGYATFVLVTYSEASPRLTPNPGHAPSGWSVTANNNIGGTQDVEVEAICMTPVTVAGIGVPQFGSLYVAIALGAVFYFMLSRRFAARPTVSSTRAVA
jgi:hypothetical protein